MSRTRLSTTVDADLLESARKASGKPDSALVDEALAAVLTRHRAAEVDASHAAYEAHPPRRTRRMGRPRLVPPSGRGLMSDLPARREVAPGDVVV